MPNSNPELNCETFEEYVQEILDSRKLPSSDPHIVKHVSNCSRCAEEMARYERLNRILSSAFQSSIQPKERRVSALQLDKPCRNNSQTKLRIRHWARKPAPTYLVLTASVVLLTVFLSSLNRNHRRLVPLASIPVAEEPTLNQFQMVSNFRSIERCYEITAEMPGVRPIQSTLNIAYHWCQDYFAVAAPDSSEPSSETPPPNETNLGVRFDEVRFRLC